MIEREAWEAVREMYIYLPAEEYPDDVKMDLQDVEIEVGWRQKLIVEWTEKWKAFKPEEFESEADYRDTVAFEKESVAELQKELDEEWLIKLERMKKKLARVRQGAR